jgi:peroxiredoxin
MKRASIWIAILACAATAHARPLAIGDVMPKAEVQAAEGRMIDLGSLGDSGALVVFHSPSCAASLAAEPALIELGNSATKQLVRTTIVDGAAAADAQRTAAARGIRFGYVADTNGTVARAFGAAQTSEAFLFDGSGHLAYHGAVGTPLAQALAAMLAKKPIASAETEPAGCPLRSGE